jgi:four helix bundle protein
MYKFEKLTIWKESLELIKSVYKLCEELPKHEEKIICSQLKRAVLSVNLNIAEGSGAENDLEFKRFLHIAKKSLFEVVAILKVIEYLYKKNINDYLKQTDKLGKQITQLIKYLKLVKSPTTKD